MRRLASFKGLEFNPRLLLVFLLALTGFGYGVTRILRHSVALNVDDIRQSGGMLKGAPDVVRSKPEESVQGEALDGAAIVIPAQFSGGPGSPTGEKVAVGQGSPVGDTFACVKIGDSNNRLLVRQSGARVFLEYRGATYECSFDEG